MGHAEKTSNRTIGGFILSALGLVLATCILFFIVEGAASVWLIGHALFTESEPLITERTHTRYDPTLGWVNIPDLYVGDMYGPGVYFQTNSQGFRNNRTFSTSVPAGKTRIICSGDSFTMSYGVNNDQAWCQLLGAADPRVETVNMGQGGYGVDQAYLWYMRDGRTLDHDIHLLAFIADDFDRVTRSDFIGYGKPVLELVDGQLAPTRVPVSRRAYVVPWLTQNGPLFNRLRSLQLVEMIRHPTGRSVDDDLGARRRAIEPVVQRIFSHLNEQNRNKRSQLVLVFLPMNATDPGDEWRTFVRAEAQQQGIPFIDMVDEVQQLPSPKAKALFADHYSVEGNRFFAERIYNRLSAIPGSPLPPATR